MRMTSNVKVLNQFPQLRRRIHEGAVPRALNAAAKEGAAKSREVASQRTDTGAMANIKVFPARHDPTGWTSGWASLPFYAWFHEHGTLGSRRRKLKQPGRARANRDAGTGIKPLRFQAAGRRVARLHLLDYLRREISRIP